MQNFAFLGGLVYGVRGTKTQGNYAPRNRRM